MNQERVSIPTDSTVSLGGYRSRYRAFLDQAKLPKPPSNLVRLGRGLLSFAIFITLFVAILTVFGLGLSWFSRGSLQKSGAAKPGNSPMAGASASMLPSPPAQPAGHAEVRPQSAAKKKTNGK